MFIYKYYFLCVMRNKTEFKKISVTVDIHKRLIADRDYFEKTIGGGSWSISDTIIEYFKIINSKSK